MDKWKQYLEESRKRGSGPGLEKSLKWFLDKGPQKKGGYPKKRRPNFRRKKFNDISAPPGAVGGLEEEVEEDSFEKQTELEPRFWEDGALNPKIAKRLEKIARDFIEGLDIPVEAEDLRFTGSLANYNWSKYSDIDLHMVVVFSKIVEDTQLVKFFFDAARMRWNELHDIKIYGYEVEIYVEDVGESHRSSGVYSISQQEWIAEPDADEVEIDFVTARKKSDDIATQVGLIQHIVDNGKLEAALKIIERLKAKIRRMRQAGLNSIAKEFSPENIAFKILRRDDTLQKLNDLKYDAYDKLMSLGETTG